MSGSGGAPGIGSGDGSGDGAVELAERFARLARALRTAPTPEDAQERVTLYAVATVPGCDHAGISLIDRHGGVVSVASTGATARRVDQIQHEVGEGPCLGVIHDRFVCAVADLDTDDRWPGFSRRAVAETGVRGLLCFRLFVEDDVLGALTLSSATPGAFDDHAVAVGTVLAAHAALAVTDARNRRRAAELDEALRSSRDIGTALGILMARRLVTRDEAFDLLRTASRRLHRKLRDVALDVVETGTLPAAAAARAER
ncbi:GAF and ANTAR domain-containing protein [Pseudonocardia halophobica]|uniref:Transcriptional regulator n=1 Tax=Pseudonocardia halophobica TaxID=29401 RepID=A0A9W6L1Z5_9PSEU|nr:GAF and ANTAR domain-containing protein [Pseudonocardia halophobica]GLL10701.1 transcriptional regulator [Pseudonocardia halophobica]